MNSAAQASLLLVKENGTIWEDATILIYNHLTNTVTKLTCVSANKDFGRLGTHNYDYLHMGMNTYYNNSAPHCNIVNQTYKLYQQLSLLLTVYTFQCYHQCINLVSVILIILEVNFSRNLFESKKCLCSNVSISVTYTHEVIDLLWSVIFKIFMFKITKSIGVMKEGILMEFH